MIFGKGHEIGGLNDARLFHHCNCRHYGGSRPWRVLLASPASGADATSEISEYSISPFRCTQPRHPAGASFLEISELSDVEAFGAVARQFSRQRPPRRGSPVNPPLDCRLLLMETTKIASVRWPGCGGPIHPAPSVAQDAEARSEAPFSPGFFFGNKASRRRLRQVRTRYRITQLV